MRSGIIYDLTTGHVVSFYAVWPEGGDTPDIGPGLALLLADTILDFEADVKGRRVVDGSLVEE